jgi:uncharacterized protein
MQLSILFRVGILIDVFLAFGFSYCKTTPTRASTSLFQSFQSGGINFKTEKLMKYFDLPLFLVIGASEDRSKFGTKVLRCMVSHKKQCIPFNKRLPEIEGIQTVDSIPTFVELVKTSYPSVPISMVGMNLITPPAVTLSLVKQGYDVGIRNFFCQPGTVDSAVEVTILQSIDAFVSS